MRNKKTCRMLPQLFLIVACTSLFGQTVISDSTYNSADWSVRVVTAFGASETYQQRLTGGNAGAFRFMEHILPAPPGPADLAVVEVTHIYNGDAHLPLDVIDHIDFAEDIKLFNLAWNQAFIVSYPAIRQSGKFYRASERRLSVIADTLWRRGSLTGLKANDFIALDGSGAHPDFSDQGDFLYFGFWRVSSRGATLPPIPPNQNLVYQHGSDNFTVTIHNAPPANQPPVARADDYLYLDYFFNSNKTLRVLANDSDPEGDPIRVLSVDEPAFGGTIESFNDTSITYSYNEPLSAGNETDFFLYKITDGLNPSLDAFVTMHFCVCPLECIALFLAALGKMQAPLRNLIDGDGSAIITQGLLDTITVFLDRLRSAASNSLRDSLNVELARLGPLQNLVGLSVAEAAETALGTSTHVDDAGSVSPNDFMLQQNYPNPLNPSTQIRYHLPLAAHVKLVVYDMQGREIKTLVDEFQSAGEKSVFWNGADHQDLEMTSGIYFYRLSAGAFRETKKMILMR